MRQTSNSPENKIVSTFLSADEPSGLCFVLFCFFVIKSASLPSVGLTEVTDREKNVNSCIVSPEMGTTTFPQEYGTPAWQVGFQWPLSSRGIVAMDLKEVHQPKEESQFLPLPISYSSPPNQLWRKSQATVIYYQ